MEFMQEDLDCLGLDDMNPMQVRVLMEFIGLSLTAATMSKNPKMLEDVRECADDLVRLLGGEGIRIETKH